MGKSTVKKKQISKSITKMNWKLLRQQKRHLLEILNNEESNITSEQHQSIEGIVALIDSLQDEAVDANGFPEETVFGRTGIECTFTSEWDDGSKVSTPCIYNEETGEVEAEFSKSHAPKASLVDEYITLINGYQISVCPECHSHVLRVVVGDRDDQSYGEYHECRNEFCDYGKI